MKNMFIPYKLALIAYEKGFKIKCEDIGLYYKRRDTGEIHGLDYRYIDTNQNIEQWDSLDEIVEAILYQQILDWFSSKGIEIIVFPKFYGDNKYYYAYECLVMSKNDINTMKSLCQGAFELHETKEEALNIAIKQALELI